MADQVVRAGSSRDPSPARVPHLPVELRKMVFSNLVPDRLPIGTSSRLPTDVLSSRKALLSLCYASKDCYAIALEFLYKHVIITDYVQLAGLLVTLIFHKERRGWIQRLAVIAEFRVDDYEPKWRHNVDLMTKIISWRETYEIQSLDPTGSDAFTIIGSYLPGLKDVIAQVPFFCDDYLNSITDDTPPPPNDYWHTEKDLEKDFDYLLCRLLQHLLKVQTNIKHILVAVPYYSEDREFDLTRSHDDIMDRFWLDPTQPVPENPLKNLVSIGKWRNPVGFEDFPPDPLAPEYLGSKDWEFIKDDGNWFFDGYLDYQGWPGPEPAPPELAVFSHVTDLSLLDSQTHPAQLWLMIGSCKSLKVLRYTIDITHLGWWPRRFKPIPATEEEDGIPTPTLQQALDQARETLKELRLGWSRPKYVLKEDEEEIFAPHKVDVTGFPRLTNRDIDETFVR